jgi:hypothetical protein
MSLFVVLLVSALVGLFVMLSLLPLFSAGAENDSLVQPHE